MVSSTRSAQHSTPFPIATHETTTTDHDDHHQETLVEDQDDDDHYQAIEGDSLSVTNDSMVLEPEILPPAVVLPTYAEVVGHSLAPRSVAYAALSALPSLRSIDDPSGNSIALAASAASASSLGNSSQLSSTAPADLRRILPVLTVPDVPILIDNVSAQQTRFVNHVPGSKLLQLKSTSTRSDILQICVNMGSKFHNYDIGDVVPIDQRTQLKLRFKELFLDDRNMRDMCDFWLTWPRVTFCTMLDLAYPDTSTTISGARTFLEKISQVVVQGSVESKDLENTLVNDLEIILLQHTDRTAEMELEAVKLLTKRLPQEGSTNWRARFSANGKLMGGVLTVDDWRLNFISMFNALRKLILELTAFGIVPQYTANSRIDRSQLTSTKPPPLPPKNQGSKRPAATPASEPSTKSTHSGCTGCGRTNHEIATCVFEKSQFFNTSGLPYWDSAVSKQLQARYPSANYIPGKKELMAMESVSSGSSSSSSSSSSGPARGPSTSSAPAKKQKGMSENSTLMSSIGAASNTDYLSVTISPLSLQLANKSEITVKALLDTGSIAGDFIADRIISLYHLEPYVTSTTTRTVCSGLDNKCYDISRSISLNISLYSEVLNKTETFQITAIVLSSTPLDLVIGRPSIKKYNLFSMVPSQISLTSTISAPIVLTESSNVSANKPCDCQQEGNLLLLESSSKRYSHLAQSESPTVAQTPGLLAAFVLESERFQGSAEPDEDEIDYDKMDVFTSWNTHSVPVSPIDVLSQIHIGGSPELQIRLRALCLEFQDIFSDELPSKPAHIDPFDMVVDAQKWKVPANRTPPRPQSSVKQAEIIRHLNIMLSKGIVEPSSSSHYSQVLLIPKGEKDSRMVIDLRNLNECTADASWPIPNIAEMLRRIGAQKPKIFGCMDLTQGYHQAPLSAAAKPFTSFITFSGVYQFTRLPFGLKRAPSYFQEQMAANVLNGLIYSICEMYIDDCNVFASDDDQFVDRLRQIFTRFRKHYLFLKASKCYFGFPELNFVGKVVSEAGLKMSQDKIRSVLDFPIPLVSKQLKSFLGFVNYFHDFVRNHSSTVKPLHALIENYDRTRKIQWNSEAVAAFKEVKYQISQCTTMHFLNDTDPISLHTDASDYGIGGFLFQTVNGKDLPVAFHSRSFSKPQLRWSVPQKEAFGIFDNITKFAVLLEGRDFTLRTDHRNLLFIKESSNPMIIRWYMALSHFRFMLEFISGADNGIADWLSRLCRNHMHDTPTEYNSEDILFATIIAKFRLTDNQYKKISEVHNSKVGHYGVDRTIKRLQQTQSWEFMRQHVKHFISKCPCCQKMSMLKTPIAAHPFTTSTYTPMECLNIDFIGPFPDGGSILVIVDTCTRWVELFATADATALSAATSLLQHFGRFGAPHQLRSDNGPHFVAEVIREFLSLIGIEHCLTLAYSKQENAIVERFNKEINRHLRALTFDNTSLKDYKLSLPFVQRILNSNYSDRLKISAADLLFGKIVNLDRGLFLPRDERPVSTLPLSTHVSNLLNIQDNLLKASAKELLRTDLLHQSSKQILIHKEFLLDSFVLVHYRTGAPPSRLHTFWRGPMRVVSGSHSRYLLYDLITHKEKVYHVSDMKPFLYDPAITNPIDIARRDYMEFFVEKILEHKGDLTKKKDIKFLVSWLGHPDSENSWEPYSNLRDTDQLHAYLTEHNMKQLIPAKFR